MIVQSSRRTRFQLDGVVLGVVLAPVVFVAAFAFGRMLVAPFFLG